MKRGQNCDRRCGVRPAVRHKRDIPTPRRAPMLRIAASTTLTGNLRRGQARVEALVQIGARLRKQDNAPLVNLVDLAFGFGDRGGGSNDTRDSNSVLGCYAAILEQRRKRSQCMMKGRLKQP